MDRETFLEQVKQQYMERITAVYMQAEHTGRVDFKQLSLQLQELKKLAAGEGVPAPEFDDLVYSLLPGVEGQVELSIPARPAAKKKAA
ncbi:MAG: hypothetical protein ACK5QT_00350 [Oligoflexia bacterium]|jgi:hypothetical protein